MVHRGGYTFRIKGAIYHRIGGLLSQNPTAANFAQVYLLDGDTQLDRRMVLMPDTDLFLNQLVKGCRQKVHRNSGLSSMRMSRM